MKREDAAISEEAYFVELDAIETIRDLLNLEIFSFKYDPFTRTTKAKVRFYVRSGKQTVVDSNFSLLTDQ